MPNWLQTLSTSADVVGIFGAAAAIYTAVTVRHIRSFYVGVGVEPRLLSRIQELSDLIESHHANYAERGQQITKDLTLLSTNLVELERTATGAEKSIIRDANLSMKSYLSGQKATQDDLWNIYRGVLQVLEHMKNVQEKRKWQQ